MSPEATSWSGPAWATGGSLTVFLTVTTVNAGALSTNPSPTTSSKTRSERSKTAGAAKRGVFDPASSRIAAAPEA